MKTVLLDTHAWAWSLGDDPRLSKNAADCLTTATAVLLSPISLFEIRQKVRLGKWPDMAPFTERLVDILAEQGGRLAPLDGPICSAAGGMAWAHRDPFDRLILATALHIGVPLVSADVVFDGQVTRVW
ncbi:MAG: type II toxin-antitoxin system VapC family toxin [Geminicoccaceae bacterium]|nr:MAG: type II toxin-antitoxin system VapC family toxin [Geminicoccaceae bacterium]